jgi:putative Holliday junction resolvase
MNLKHGKYLGVDYGDKRTGISECDLSGSLASGITTVRESGMRHTAMRVAKEALERSCVKIIVGLPKNMDGSEGERAKTVRAFCEILTEYTDLPIDFSDERMSTMLAYRYMDTTETYGKKRRESVDTLSAEIILQSYLDKERKGETENGKQ